MRSASALRLALCCALVVLPAASACNAKPEANDKTEANGKPEAGQTHAAPAGWSAFGDGVAASAKPLSIQRILAAPADYNGKTVAIEGTIHEVCQNKGCWLTMQDGDKEMRVRFKDYAFFVPKDCAGKTVRVEGVFAIEKISVEDARHYLEDAGKTEEAAKITEPVDGYTFMASGVALQN